MATEKKKMIYTKEDLMSWSFNRLIETIIDLQEQLEDVDKYQKAVEKITRIVENTNSECDRPEGYRGGRRKYTPEEKAAAYERQKERQKIKYWAAKGVAIEKTEENNDM